MKLRTTTPASISLKARLSLISIAVLMATVGSIQFAHTALADKYDDQINALQNDINAYNAQAAVLSSQAKTLQSALATLANEAAVIQAQINLSQAQYDKLVVQIADTEKKIIDNQDALGQTIADLYIDGKVSPLEMLASSTNIGDYLDKQTFRSSIRDQLGSTITQIKTLKTELDKQKIEVTRVLGDQQNSKNALALKQNEQQNILDQTQGQESAYQQLASSTQAKQDNIRAQQQAAIAAAYNSTGGAHLIRGGADGNYPWNGSNCPMSGYYSLGGSNGNGGDGYGYGCRQCASYAAYRVAKETGNYPVNWGDATNFPASARASGFATGGTARPGSLAVLHNGAEGHVAWVESVNGDGSMIVSQYNYNYGSGWGMYSQMSLSTSAFQEYIYIK